MLPALSACASSTAFVGRSGGDSPPWLVPGGELGTQRLFRAQLETPQGRGRLRLLLRLETEKRYRIDSTHPLFNRRLWSFELQDGEALLVDYMQKVACRYTGEVEIAALPLGPFQPRRLPALLLGYLPLIPGPGSRDLKGEEVELADESGRLWTARLSLGSVQSWELRDDEGLRAEWAVEEEWAVLRAREEGIRVRWRETVREPLASPPQALEIPERFVDGDCDLGWIEAVADTWEEGDED